MNSNFQHHPSVFWMRTPLNPSVQNVVFPLQMVIDCEWISQCLYFLKINRFLTCLWIFKSHYTRFFFVSCQVHVWAFRTTSVSWWHPDVFSFHVISHLHTLTIHNCTKHRCPFPIGWLINRRVCLPLEQQVNDDRWYTKPAPLFLP